MSNPGGNFGPTTMAMGEENAQQTPPQSGNNNIVTTMAVGEESGQQQPGLPGGSNMMTMATPENGQPQDPRDIFRPGNRPEAIRPGFDNNNISGPTTLMVGEESGQQPGSPGGNQMMTR